MDKSRNDDTEQDKPDPERQMLHVLLYLCVLYSAFLDFSMWTKGAAEARKFRKGYGGTEEKELQRKAYFIL